MAELYFRQNVDVRLNELDEGKSVSHEEAKKRLNRWLKYTLFISQRIYKISGLIPSTAKSISLYLYPLQIKG
jgi:hypothetical protein